MFILFVLSSEYLHLTHAPIQFVGLILQYEKCTLLDRYSIKERKVSVQRKLGMHRLWNSGLVPMFKHLIWLIVDAVADIFSLLFIPLMCKLLASKLSLLALHQPFISFNELFDQTFMRQPFLSVCSTRFKVLKSSLEAPLLEISLERVL